MDLKDVKKFWPRSDKTPPKDQTHATQNKKNNTATKSINLALQGGGAHGAYTWGVLDKILEDGRLRIHAISGTSAGAMNAVVVAEGYEEGGAEGARTQLENFWRGISDAAQITSTPAWLSMLNSGWGMSEEWSALWLGSLKRMASPYMFNPFNYNPIVDLLETHIDFDHLRSANSIKLFIGATNVHTGKIKIFQNKDLTARHVMASACLPDVFQAVNIDGVPYWDGGYMGNPALFPFFYTDAPNDVVLVQVNPVERRETPETPLDIQNRINEISFNASLLGELRAIAFVQKLIETGYLHSTHYRHARLHRIHDDDRLNQFPASTKMNTDWHFLCTLRDYGRSSAEAFLEKHFADIGHQSSLDISTMLD